MKLIESVVVGQRWRQVGDRQVLDVVAARAPGEWLVMTEGELITLNTNEIWLGYDLANA